MNPKSSLQMTVLYKVPVTLKNLRKWCQNLDPCLFIRWHHKSCNESTKRRIFKGHSGKRGNDRGWLCR